MSTSLVSTRTEEVPDATPRCTTQVKQVVDAFREFQTAHEAYIAFLRQMNAELAEMKMRMIHVR